MSKRKPRTKYQKKWYKENREKTNARSTAWYRANPEKGKAQARKNELKKKYGLTLEDYNQIFAEQNGKCAICGIHQSELRRALDVDHCHETGKVRGLLCSGCNRGISALKDDIENLRCAILYLNK